MNEEETQIFFIAFILSISYKYASNAKGTIPFGFAFIPIYDSRDFSMAGAMTAVSHLLPQQEAPR